MKFDFAIGNPPYQQEAQGANANDTPIYHYFFDAAYEIAEKVELIAPARFLFNAGGTPKEWNAKMLSDPNLKVLDYESRSADVFPNTSITGGVAITYHDSTKEFGAIGAFTSFESLNSILGKVCRLSSGFLSDIVSNRGQYRFSSLAYAEHPDALKKTADPRIAPSAFERMPELFTDIKPDDDHEYIRIYGNRGSERICKWFRRDYLKPVSNLDKYKVFISKADGAAGQIGNPIPARITGRPVVIEPGIGSTETFISVGEVDTESEADAIAKYLLTRFARTMVGVLKVTQNNARPTWAKVPIQDFTPNSDIDWSKSIPEIDQQLYAKYGLSSEEIEFIETHVKEMN